MSTHRPLPGLCLPAMSGLCTESSEESEVEEIPQDHRLTRLMARPKAGSPGGSPRISPKDSPRGSPRNSPLLFRKLMMNRSINLQRRRFTLAHTPRYSCTFPVHNMMQAEPVSLLTVPKPPSVLPTPCRCVRPHVSIRWPLTPDRHPLISPAIECLSINSSIENSSTNVFCAHARQT